MSSGLDEKCICCVGVQIENYMPGLHRCQDCGHVWAGLELSDEEIKEIYSKGYFAGEEYLDYAQEEPALRRNFRPRILELAKRHPQGARLWEIGCAFGFFLKQASSHFDVMGCDISDDAVQYASGKLGLAARAVDYLEYEQDDNYDVICMWDTVEHLREPHRYIEKIYKDLRPGGTIALTTGDIGSLNAKMRGASWRMLHPPSHSHYFTIASMTALLDRMGFTDIEIRHHAQWRSADLTAYIVLKGARPGLSGSVYRLLKRAGVLSFFFPINLFDIMTVYARRPE